MVLLPTDSFVSNMEPMPARMETNLQAMDLRRSLLLEQHNDVIPSPGEYVRTTYKCGLDFKRGGDKIFGDEKKGK